MTKPILMVIGPTAVGKSRYAIQEAHRRSAEIISADAFQVYRGMDVGTGKLVLHEREGISHHLLDIVNPDEPYSVADFLALTSEHMRDIQARGKSVIICGGTAFYLKAFLRGSGGNAPVGETNRRQHLFEQALHVGAEGLWQHLLAIDPKRAGSIHPNDLKRVVRALEIFQTTGVRPSDFQSTSLDRSDVEIVGLFCEREILKERIHERVKEMFKKGWVSEVEGLMAKGYGPTLRAFEAIGYKEIASAIVDGVKKTEMLESIETKTRQFAKRQMTWFKRFVNVNWKMAESL